MKLSLERKLGWMHVRGGKLVKVTQVHGVPTVSRSTLQTEHARPRKADGMEMCRRGDLAMQILKYETGVVVGYSYLSGPAIQLQRYEGVSADWFAPAQLGAVSFPAPTEMDVADEKARDDFWQRFFAAVQAIKYGPLDVAGFCRRESTLEDGKAAAELLRAAWSMAPVEQPAWDTHLLGMFKIVAGGDMALHYQPPKHGGKLAASGFQIGLVLSALDFDHDKNCACGFKGEF